MKTIATLISFILTGLVVFLFSKQRINNENNGYVNMDEDYGEMIGQETLKHL